MGLVDLSSDLSRFRSEVSREPKNTPEASKATNNKNFATFQPISAKLSQFGQNIKKQEPNQLESKLSSTKLDDIRKVVQQNLLINSVSKYSMINEDFAIDNSMITTDMISSKYGRIKIDEFSSKLTKSNIVPIKQQAGVYNNTSPTEVVSNKDEQSNNIVNPNIEINRPPQSFERAGTSPNVKPLGNEQTNNIVNPDIQINRQPLSFERDGSSPDVKPLPNEQSNNIVIPEIQINRPAQSFEREDTSPNVTPLPGEQTNNIINPNIDVIRKALFLDREDQAIEISKDLVSPINNITDPKTVLDLNILTYERSDQSPFILTDTKTDGFVKNPNIRVFRFDGTTVQTEDNSRLNLDGLPLRFIPISRLEKFELPREIDVQRYDGESVQIEDNSNLNLDTVIKTIPFGRHENPEGSNFSIIGTQQVNFFFDTNAKGFIVKQQKGETQYLNNSQFGWNGKKESAPVTNFFTDINGKGFTKFVQQGVTDYDTESSVFGFIDVVSTDFFDITKKNTSEGFKTFSTLYESDYKPDTSVYTFSGKSDSAPVVNYFDLNGSVTTDGFTKFAQIYDTKYIPDSSIFTWDGSRNESPESNFFDIDGKSTTAGFHKFAQIYDTKYIPDSSQFDWDGTRQNAPENNYFDISGTNTTTGFHKFAQLYDTKYIAESSVYDWDGTKQDAPEVNYFDVTGKNTSSGFHKFASLYDTKYVHESSIYDWDGTKQNAPEVNYFDLNSSNTIAGFHRFAQLYDTKYVHESSIYDWDGTKQDAPEVNYFDLGGKNTTIGFHKFASLYDTKYIHESSTYDWDGVRTNSPEVNFFDLNKQHQTVGFHRLAQKYDSKYIKDASIFDFDGGYRDAPETDFFDLDKKFVSKGFEKFTQPYVTRYIKDSSRFDFDGTKQDAPETDFFDISKKNTTKGFEKFPQLLVTKYVKDSSQFDFDGTSRNAPTVNYFPNTNANGFTSFAAKLQTEYVPDSSEYTFKGTLPTEINFFPDDNQSGFINKTPLLETKYVKDSSNFTFKGSLPTPIDFLDNTNADGFTIKSPLLESKFVEDSSNFTFKGTRSDAPTTDYFPNDFGTGFTKLVQSFQTEFKPETSRFTFKGSRQDAPSVDYLQNTPAPGFQILAPMLESFYIKGASKFTWNGTRSDAPSVDFFKIPASNPNGISGFDTLFTDVTDTKLGTEFSRFSFDSVKNYSSVKKVPYTKFFGFNPKERSGFLVNMTNRNSSLYPLIDPSFRADDPADIRFSVEGARSGNRRQKTTDDVGKYAPITLGGLFWSDGTNTGTATLGNQVPFMKVKSEGFSSTYFRKYEKFAKDSTQGLGYLTKWATTRRSPSPLDNQYNKYSLQQESVNREVAAFNQPYVVRGIQRTGEVENQRWGFGVTFDDGFVRGGAVTQVERILQDVFRLGKWTASVKGALFNVRQLALQVMNPVTDVDPDNQFTSGILGLPYPSTMLFNPVTLIANVATARIGMHLPRHGVLPFSNIFLNRYETATKNREMKANLTSRDYKAFNNPDLQPPSSTNRDPGGYSRMIGLMKELLPNSFSPILSNANNTPNIGNTVQDIQNAANTVKDIGAATNGVPDPEKVANEKAKEIQNKVEEGKSAYKNPGGTTNTSAGGEHSNIYRLTTSFGGPNSFLGIGGTTFRRARHPYLTYYTTTPDLYDSKNPAYNDYMKRDTYFAATKIYGDHIFENSLIRALYYLLKGDPNKPEDVPEFDSSNVAIQNGVKSILKSSKTFDPHYPLEGLRNYAITKFDQDRHGKLKLSEGPGNVPNDDTTIANSIKRYRTANYDQLKRNSRKRSNKFNDFRAGITLGDSTAPFITDPTIARFDTRNLTDRYGFGDQGDPGAQRNQPFLNTIQYSKFSRENNQEAFNVNVKSSDSPFEDYAVPVEKTIEGKKLKFRGDRINIIDYKRSNFNINTNTVYEKGNYTNGLPGADDLVEFYFTSLVLSGHKNCPSEIIVFRATFDSITDNHNPSWNSVKYMGRADPLYTYQGYEREISFGFTVHIGSRDEMKASWRKLNYLASWTAPEYLKSGLMRGPMVRLNIGHLYRKMPGYISSLSYTFDNQNGTWETAKLPEDMNLTDPKNAEKTNPGVLQLPKTVQVSVSFVPVGVYRPEFRGIMYSLYDDRAKDWNGIETGLQPISSNRVNYFKEFDDLSGIPTIYSGVDVNKKDAEDGDYGKAENTIQSVDTEPITPPGGSS